MSWLRLEDNMLDHPKWRRALRMGGDEVVATWVRLVSWCSRNLTDGRVPADMVAQVAEVRSVERSRPLRALADAGLIQFSRPNDDALTSPSRGADVMVTDYLQWNRSREQVLTERSRKTESQRKRRLAATEAGLHETSEAACSSVPSHPIPSHPIPIESASRSDARVGTDATPLHRERTPSGADTRRPQWWSYPPDWRWSLETEGKALEQGVHTDALSEHVAYWTTHEFARPVTDLNRELVRCLPAIRKRRETEAFKAAPRAGPQRSSDVFAYAMKRISEEESKERGGS